MRRIAIVGCRPPPVALRTAESLALFRAIAESAIALVHSLPLDVVVVSGDAAGVDSVATTAAEGRGMIVCRCPVAPAAWARLGRRAGMIRNGLIVDISHEAHAFPVPWGRGTQGCVKLFREAGKTCTVHEVRP